MFGPSKVGFCQGADINIGKAWQLLAVRRSSDVRVLLVDVGEHGYQPYVVREYGVMSHHLHLWACFAGQTRGQTTSSSFNYIPHG